MKNIFFLEKLFNQDSEKGIITFASKFSLISLILGSFALTVSLSLLEGFDSTIHNLAYKFDSHYQISTFNRTPIHINKNLENKLNSFKEIKTKYPLINNYALVKSSKDIKTLLIKGVSNDYLKDKFNIEFKNNDEIILSEKLKSILIDGKNELAMFSFPDQNNYYNYNVNKFISNQYYKTGFSDYDDNIAFINLEKAQEIYFDNSNKINTFELVTENENHKFQSDLERILEYPFIVRSTEQIHQDKFIWIEVQKQPIPIVLGLITLVSCFVIVSSLLIMIVKKFRSIGILRAIGMNKSDMLLYFLSYGLKLGLKGSIIGCGIGIILLLIQKQFKIIQIPSDIYFLSELPVEILPLNILIIIFVSLTLTILATIIPATISIRLDPINAIKLKE